jgi:hypothetical protein
MNTIAARSGASQIRGVTRAWGWTSRALIIVMLASMVAFIASVFLRPADEVMLWADLGLYSAPMLIAGILAMIRGLSGGLVMRPWIAVAIALFVYVIGNVFYSLSETWQLPLFFPPIPDLFWLAFYPIAFLGVVVLTKRRLPAQASYAWLDALVVGTGFFAVVMALANRSITGQMSDDPDLVVLNSLYVVGDLVLLALVVTVIQAFSGRPPLAWWLLLAGFVMFALADASYLVQSATGTYVEGAWLDAR